MYSTYTEDDFSVIWDTYQYVQQKDDWWFRKDFGKENVTSASPNHSTTYATVQGMWAKQVCLQFCHSWSLRCSITRTLLSSECEVDTAVPSLRNHNDRKIFSSGLTSSKWICTVL